MAILGMKIKGVTKLVRKGKITFHCSKCGRTIMGMSNCSGAKALKEHLAEFNCK